MWFFKLIITSFILSLVSSQCGESCLNCTSSNLCTSCVSQNNLILRNDSLSCVPCPQKCQKCTSQNQLKQCIGCSTGYYQDPIKLICLQCEQPNCKQCNPYSPSQCISCQTQYYLQQTISSCKLCNESYPNSKTCRQNFITLCQDGYFTSNGQTCNKCSINSSCKSCSSSTLCTQCFDGYFLTTGSKCTPCDPTCKTCNTNTSCSSCHKGYRINSSSKCQICSTLNCASCTIQDICQQCGSNYYLDGQTKICVLLPLNKTILSCIKYSNNFNLSVSSIYPQNQILCRGCINGGYVSMETNSCQSCSLLCESCSGMYRSSKCLSCNRIFGRMIDSSNGICGSKLFTVNNQKVLYLNNRNNADNYQRRGKLILFPQGSVKCPGGELASQLNINLTSSKGYHYTIYTKILIYSLTSIPYHINVKFNSNLVYSYFLNQSNISSLSSNVQKCNNITVSNFTFSFSLAQLNFIQYSSNQSLQNILSFSSPQIEDILIDVKQIVILVKQCHSTCFSCLIYEQCTRCKNQQQFLQQQKCVDNCDDGYFFNQAKKQCVLQCPQGMYNDFKSIFWTCKPCNSSCQVCSQENICNSCKDGFYLYQNTCITECPNQYFKNKLFKKCEKCSSPCDTCFSMKQCTSCEMGFYFSSNNTCVNECPQTFYGNIKTMQCQKCISPCQTCKQKTQCLSCQSILNLAYYENKCIEKCPTGYYAKKDEKNFIYCEICSFPCLQCMEISSKCTKCKSGYLFMANNTCLSSCPNGYFDSKSSMLCIECMNPCNNCKDSQYLCTSCKQGYFYNLYENSCLKSCSKSYYGDNKTFNCKPCPSECKQCLSSSTCLICNQNYYLQKDLCVQNCVDGYYKGVNNSQNLCIKCSQNCLKCFGDSEYCLQCNTGFQLLPNNTCSSVCKITQLSPGCKLCEYPCYSCQKTVSNCTSCQNGFYLFLLNNQCVSECYIGYYKVIEKGFGLCHTCPIPCSNCQNQNICHSCFSINSTNYYLQTISANKKICVINCSLYQYKNQKQKICIKCISPCLTCFNMTYCTSCQNGILINGNCLSQSDGCPIGTFQTQKSQFLDTKINSTLKICLSCPQKCTSCKSTSLCTACKQNLYLFGNSCVDFCLSGITPIKNLRTCIFCSYPCAECQGSSSYCTKCQQMQLNSSSIYCPQQRKMGNICIKYFLLKGQCLNDCPPNTFPKEDKCNLCITPCLTCKSDSICTSCIDNYYMLQNKCYVACPQEYYASKSTEQCQKCQYPCKTCKSLDLCLTCIEGYFYNGKCLIKQSCPVGYFESWNKTLGNFCQQCDSQCLACTNSKNNCVQCYSQSLFEGQCYEKCPNGYYSHKKLSLFKNNFTVFSCEKCKAQCLSCTSQHQCLNCIYPYFLLVEKCVQKCPPDYMERISTFQFNPNIFYSTSACSACQSPCKSCFLEENLCQSCIQDYFMYNKKCLLNCPNGTYLNNLTNSCKECPFPCRSCVQINNDVICKECTKGYYLKKDLCVDKCQEEFIDVEGKKCVKNCNGTFMVEHIKSKVKFCANQCKHPYLKSIDVSSCLTQCSSGQYVNSQHECKQIIPSILPLIPQPKIHLFINSKGILSLYMEMNRIIQFTGSIELKQIITIKEKQYSLNSQRLLQNSSSMNITSQQTLPFLISEKSSQFIIIELYLNKSISYPGYLQVLFEQNSNLYIVDKISRLPLASSYYKVELTQNQSYEAYQLQFINNRFGYIGEIIMDFVFILSIGLIIFNRYAKIYHFLTFVQSIFMLACLDISIPPNLYRFLQGFKFAHFYQFQNWIDSLNSNQRYTDFSNKGFSRLESMFGDINFIRVSGHFITLFTIILAILIVIYLTRFLPKFSNELFLKAMGFLNKKLQHIKWSHLTDFFISTFMLILASFFFQTIDYSVRKTQQAIGIALSYIFMLMYLFYGIYFCFKTYKIVKLSEREPDKFIKKEYLQRQEYISFFQGITSVDNCYKNYMIMVRIIIYGVLTGLIWNYANLCLSIWMIFEMSFGVIYIWKKPFALETQNYIYGIVSLIYLIAMILIIVTNQYKGGSTKLITNIQQNHQQILNTKTILGYFIIILIVICVFLLLIQMIISIIRGSFKPKKLLAEEDSYKKIKQNSPNSLIISKFTSIPKKIPFEQKKQLTGYKIKGIDQKSKTSQFSKQD